MSMTPAARAVYTEANIVNALAHNTFKGALCVVPNTLWTGYEADLLVVTKNLRALDVEVKISRTDLRADREKGKWRSSGMERIDGRYVFTEPRPLEWPRSIFRHYYAIAAPVWRDELLADIQPASGVLTVELWETSPANMRAGVCRIDVKRRAKSNPAAEPLELSQVVDIARLASLRYWTARLELDRHRAEVAA
jgi:hypothetical protein